MRRKEEEAFYILPTWMMVVKAPSCRKEMTSKGATKVPEPQGKDMSAPILRMLKITKSFDGVKALSSVDFELIGGEIHGIVGQNGAGKSTLMKILSGVYRKDSGELMNPRKYRISTVFQEFSLIPELSVGANIFLNNEPRKGFLIDDMLVEEEVRKLFNELRVGEYIDAKETVANLSVSSCQLVEITKAMARKSRILILDEPTSALSDSEKQTLFHVMKNLKEEGVSIVFISHYLEDILSICDRITVLRDGMNILTDYTRNIDIDMLIRAMVGEKGYVKSSFRRSEVDRNLQPLLEASVKSDSSGKLKDIELKLHRGEVVGIAGLLGSGRTELLNSIYGIDRKSKKTMIIEGRKVDIRSPSDAIKHGIAMIPEDRRKQGLILEQSVKDNILLPILNTMTKFPGFIDDVRGDHLARDITGRLRVKLANIWQKVKLLSGGNQQKVVLSKALIHNSNVLLLDDPTSGIDISSKQDIYNIIHDFTESGKAVVWVSSEFSELSQHCDRIVVLKKGRIVSQINCSEVEDLNEEKLLKFVEEVAFW